MVLNGQMERKEMLKFLIKFYRLGNAFCATPGWENKLFISILNVYHITTISKISR